MIFNFCCSIRIFFLLIWLRPSHPLPPCLPPLSLLPLILVSCLLFRAFMLPPSSWSSLLVLPFSLAFLPPALLHLAPLFLIPVTFLLLVLLPMFEALGGSAVQTPARTPDSSQCTCMCIPETSGEEPRNRTECGYMRRRRRRARQGLSTTARVRKGRHVSGWQRQWSCGGGGEGGPKTITSCEVEQKVQV